MSRLAEAKPGLVEFTANTLADLQALHTSINNGLHTETVTVEQSVALDSARTAALVAARHLGWALAKLREMPV